MTHAERTLRPADLRWVGLCALELQVLLRKRLPSVAEDLTPSGIVEWAQCIWAQASETQTAEAAASQAVDEVAELRYVSWP